MLDFQSKECKRSRNAYMIQCTVEYFISLLVTDAFLAKLLQYVGLSDSLIGIISSFITLAFIIQLFSIFLIQRKINTKRVVIFYDTLSIIFFMLLYLIPFIPISQGMRTIFIILSVILAYGGKYLILSICYGWGNSFVEPRKRAVFSAKKEMLSLLLGMIFTALVGYIIDRYEALGNIEGGFLFSAIAILILNICNFLCLSMIQNEDEADRYRAKESKKSLSDVLKKTIGSKPFRKIIFLTILWDMARYFTIGFLGTFKTKELMMSLVLVQVVNIVANFARMMISVSFGRFSDKHSFVEGFRLALWIAAGAFFVNIFTTPERWYLIIVYTILFNCCQAGVNQNSFNITYNYVDGNYIAEAMAVKNSIGGVFGFLASVAGSKILDIIQKNGNIFLGISCYGQQVLSGISLILVMGAILFINKKIKKEKVIVQ